MGDAFGNWFITHNPTLFWMALASIISGFVVWMASKFHNRIKKVENETVKIGSIEETLSRVTTLCERIEYKIDDNYLPKLEKTIDKLDKAIGSINRLVFYLGNNDKNMKPDIFMANSLLQLSDIGKEILRVTGGEEFVDKNINHLMRLMDDAKYKSALDVENNSFLVIMNQSDSDDFTKIKNYIYNNPVLKSNNITIGLNINLVSQVMGIYLRDKYLEKHIELKS